MNVIVSDYIICQGLHYSNPQSTSTSTSQLPADFSSDFPMEMNSNNIEQRAVLVFR